ncbi:hypothetical protein [Burkholderia ambifaria]|uniref:hypothetical protein n=1 Tax=Burkholderia ambifaria TaxID=152480 RepID=UPI001589B3BF|nr:hypothetical protein [Burkholderia ambifaria]
MTTDQANQKQDVATLNRETSNLNGTVGRTPDLQQVLSNQSDLIGAAQAAAETETIAKQIGSNADKKREEAQTNANNATDPTLKAQYQQKANNWAEGGDNRVALHIAGGALTGGLTGGGLGAVGGAAGAGVSAKLAPQLNEIAQSIKDAGPAGNSNVDELLGNVTSNLLAGGAGALAGGGTGALTSAAVDRFNRQLHPQEKALAKQLAEKSKGKYTQAQIEDQMRIMGVSVNGRHESGAPVTLVGETPTDLGAQWIGGKPTADGQMILTQKTSLSEPLCVRHKLMAKEPLYATQTQGRSDDRTGQGLEPGPGTHRATGARHAGPGDDQ